MVAVLKQRTCSDLKACKECREAGYGRFIDRNKLAAVRIGSEVKSVAIRNWDDNPPSQDEIAAKCSQIRGAWDETHLLASAVDQPEMYFMAGIFDQAARDLKTAVVTNCKKQKTRDELRAIGIRAWKFLMSEQAAGMAELVSCEPETIRKNIIMKSFRDAATNSRDGFRRLRRWLIRCNADRVAPGSLRWYRKTFGV